MPEPPKMDMRELKALELAARSKIILADDGTWRVPGATPDATYRVVTWPGAESCTCPDYELRKEPCKHVIAARLVEEREGKRPAPPMDTAAVPKRKTYRQDWPAYNLAQTTEKDRFQELLHDLCHGIVGPLVAQGFARRVSTTRMSTHAETRNYRTGRTGQARGPVADDAGRRVRPRGDAPHP